MKVDKESSRMKRVFFASALALTFAALTLLPNGGTVFAQDAAKFPVFPDEDKGADPAVPAEKGGKGFAAVAEKMGYKTNLKFPLIGSPKAVKGGELVRSATDYPSNFRPIGPQANTSFNFLARELMFETLLELHPNTLSFIPALATHWKKSDDGMQFWFRLNPNARWADGNPITTEDVILTWKLRVDPKLGDAFSKLTWEKFHCPTAESKYILTVKCKKRNWRNFLYFGSSMYIFPAKILKDYIDNKDKNAGDWVKDFNTKFMMASGPYEMKEEDQKKGSRFGLRRRQDYWAANHRRNVGRFNFNRISRVVIPEAKIAFERLKKGAPGDINFHLVTTARRWVEDMTPEKIDAMKRGLIQKRKIYNEQPQGVSGLAINMNREPYKDVRVRKALSLLLPRKRLMAKLMYNQYEDLTSYFPGGIYSNPKNPKNGFSARKALKLLAQAGWTRSPTGLLVNKAGKKLSMTLTYSSKGLEPHLTLYQQYLKKAGISLNLDFTRHEQLWQRVQEKNYGLCMMAWGGLLFPNPENSFHSKFAKVKNNNNITGVSDPKIDKLLEEYDKLGIDDQKRREEIVREIDGILANLYPYVLFWYGPFERFLYWNNFGHPESGITRVGDYDDVDKYWWWDPKKAETVAKGRKDSAVTMPSGEVIKKYWIERKEAKKEQ